MDNQTENNQPAAPVEAPTPPLTNVVRIEDIYGIFPRVSTTPTWVPRKFQESFAIDTTNSIFYFYNFDTSAWVSANVTDAHIRSLLSATAPVLYNSSTGVISITPFSGDGSDGTVTLDGSTSFAAFSSLAANIYTLSRDVFFDTLTINTGVTLNPNGYAVFCKNTISGAGKISSNGGGGGNGVQGGIAGPGSGGAGGGAGTAAIASAHTFAATPAGKAGGAGSNGAADGTAGTAGTSENPSLGVSGDVGGKGGQGLAWSGGAGGGAGAATSETVIVSNSSYSGNLSSSGTTTVHTFNYPRGSTSLGSLSPSAGSGSGGGGGSGSTGNYGGGGGGGSGACGGIVYVIANTITGTITIEANGGDGGNGGGQTSGSGGGGGGGAGSGGVVIAIYTTLGGSVTIQALHGTGGAKGTGVAPNDADAGSGGTNGHVFKLNIV